MTSHGRGCTCGVPAAACMSRQASLGSFSTSLMQSRGLRSQLFNNSVAEPSALALRCASQSTFFLKLSRRSRNLQSCQADLKDRIEGAQVGDTASIHFTAFGENGERLESTRDAGQALNFEVGSSSAIGNELLQIFDEGILGMSVGENRMIALQSVQEDWNKDLIFSVPRAHEEILRLEGKFRSSGGLSKGMIVELANGQQAQVVKLSSDAVVLDANHAAAGRKLNFDVELVHLEKGAR